MNVLTPDQNKQLKEWRLQHQQELVRRGRFFSGLDAHEVDEAVQHTWFKAVVYVHKLTDRNVLQYLTQVLTNHLRDMANGRKQTVAIDGVSVEMTAQVEEPPRAWAGISDQDIERAIRALPLRTREAYVLRRQGLKHREVADRMGISTGGVGALLHGAHEGLRAELRRLGVLLQERDST